MECYESHFIPHGNIYDSYMTEYTLNTFELDSVALLIKVWSVDRFYHYQLEYSPQTGAEICIYNRKSRGLLNKKVK